MACLFTKFSSAFCMVSIFSDASRKNTIVKTNIMLLAKRKYNFRLRFLIMADLQQIPRTIRCRNGAAAAQCPQALAEKIYIIIDIALLNRGVCFPYLLHKLFTGK